MLATYPARTVVAALLAACVLLLGGCEHFQRMSGSPTQADVDKVQSQYEEAEKANDELRRERDKLAREIEAAQEASARIDAQRGTLAKMQSQVALALASAPDDARPFLEQQLDGIRQQMRALDDARGAWAQQIAGFARGLADVDAAVEASGTRLVALAEEIGTLEDRAKAASERTAGLLSDAGRTIATFVPGAAPVLEIVGPWLVGGLATAGPVFGVVAARARRRRQEVEAEKERAVAERDGARKVIAITEQFGLEAIATNPAVKDRARVAVAADPVALREFALATAQGKSLRMPDAGAKPA